MGHDPPSLRANNFDVLRFAMAMLVVLTHSWVLLRGGSHGEPLTRWVRDDAVTLGAFAVDVFFLISGFLVTMSWQRSAGWPAYLGKRVRRIYPGFIALMFVCAFLVAPFAVAPGAVWMSWPRFANVLSCCVRLREYYVPTAFDANPFKGAMQGSVWTLAYEFRCYLLLMALGLSGLLRRRWIIVGIWTLIMVLYVIGVRPHYSSLLWRAILADGESWPRFAASFFAGALFYLFRARLAPRASWAVLAAAAVIVGSHWPLTYRLLLPTAGAYLLFWVAFQPVIRWPRFARYGDFSYGIYLFSFPIQQLLALWITKAGRSVSPLEFFLLSAPPSLAAGILSWHLIEKHFLHRLPKKELPNTSR